MRYEVINSFINSYESILNWLDTLTQNVQVDNKTRNDARSHLLDLEKFNKYYIIRIMHFVLQHIQPVHSALQGRGISLATSRQLIANLSTVFSGLDTATKLLKYVPKRQFVLGLSLPAIPRVSGRRSSSLMSVVESNDVASHFVDMFSRIIDLAVESVAVRFSNNDLDQAYKIEKILLPDDDLISDSYIDYVASLFPNELVNC